MNYYLFWIYNGNNYSFVKDALFFKISLTIELIKMVQLAKVIHKNYFAEQAVKASKVSISF